MFARHQLTRKIVALLALLGLCFVIAWLGIQLVRVFPSALTALMTVASEVYTYNPSSQKALVLKPTETSVQTNTPVTIAWEKPYDDGEYSFTYTCTDGVSLLQVLDTEQKSLPCGEKSSLGTSDTAVVVATSTNQATTTIDYTITYENTNTTLTADAALTVAGIPPAAETPSTEKPKPVVAGAATTSPTYVPFTYRPVSNENGIVDLQVTNSGVGSVDGTSFTPGTLTANEAGAVRFVIQNIGTKTSGDWVYTATLPDGSTYASPSQRPLLPNERVVLTLAVSESKRGTAPYGVSVTTQNDSVKSNNSFSTSVSIQ